MSSTVYKIAISASELRHLRRLQDQLRKARAAHFKAISEHSKWRDKEGAPGPCLARQIERETKLKKQPCGCVVPGQRPLNEKFERENDAHYQAKNRIYYEQRDIGLEFIESGFLDLFSEMETLEADQ